MTLDKSLQMACNYLRIMEKINGKDFLSDVRMAIGRLFEVANARRKETEIYSLTVANKFRHVFGSLKGTKSYLLCI